jgi:uncharacterized protein YigE (DUF2233 family)
MKQLYWTIIPALMIAFACGWWFWPRLAPPPVQSVSGLPQNCRTESFESVAYIICEVTQAQNDIELYLTGADGKPYERLAKAAAEHPFLFAMNAGMYHEDFSPVRLFVEGGKEVAPLNQADAPGNFFMKPNGVFLIDMAGNAGVMETGAFAVAKPAARIATQSGPMLVIDGQIHPKFEPNGESRYIRNGVGVRDPQTVFFAISREPVSLGSFARLFRDHLRCPNALFFDGAVSALYDGSKYLIGGDYTAGPIVAVSKKASQ